MNLTLNARTAVATAIALATVFFASAVYRPRSGANASAETNHGANGAVTIYSDAKHDLSQSLKSLAVSVKEADGEETEQQPPAAPIKPPVITTPPGAEKVEQKAQGSRASAELVESFDGMGVGFEGPQGTARANNPSDNSLAVGP